MLARGSCLHTLSLAAILLGSNLIDRVASAEEWKFAIGEIEGSVQDAYAQEFKRLIEEKTGGEVTVTIYPYGALGTSADLTELVSQGAIQFANASPSHLGILVPEMQIFSIPYLLPESNEVNKQVLTESEVLYEELQDDFNNKGVQLLTMYVEGPMVWTTNKEVRSPEDFANFKMRTTSSPMMIATYEAFGATPTPMPYAEVYSGLQLNQIDGQVNPIFAVEAMKLYEVTDYIIWAGQQQLTTTVVTNSDWYQADLSDEHRQILEETIAELANYIFEMQERLNQERLEKIKTNSGIPMIELTAEEMAVFSGRAEAIVEMYVEQTGEHGFRILDLLKHELRHYYEIDVGPDRFCVWIFSC